MEVMCNDMVVEATSLVEEVRYNNMVVVVT